MPGNRNEDEERWLDISQPAEPLQRDANRESRMRSSVPPSTGRGASTAGNPYASGTTGAVSPPGFRNPRINQLAIVHIFLQLLGSLLAGLILFVGMVEEKAGSHEFLGIGLLLAVLQVPGIVGAVGLMRRRNWARVLMIVLGVLWLAVLMPIGLLIGGYTIYLLTRPEIAAEFS